MLRFLKTITSQTHVNGSVTSEPTKSQARITIQSFVELQQHRTDWLTIECNGWKLPATSEPHDWCGEWQRRGCLDVANHQKYGYGNNIFVRQYKRSCYRPTCKICYHQWIIRQANRATRRIEKYAKLSKKKPFHLMLSVSLSDYALSYKALKKKLSLIIKELGVFGSAIVFHPFRLRRPGLSKDGSVNISMNLIKAPTKILDYIIIHELCHIRIPNHSPRYWDLVYRLMPDYEESKKWLEHHEAKLL